MTKLGSSVMGRLSYYSRTFGGPFAYTTIPQDGMYWTPGSYVINGANSASGAAQALISNNTVHADGYLVVGAYYTITTLGNSDFTRSGAIRNELGRKFKASTVGTAGLTGSCTRGLTITSAQIQGIYNAVYTERGRWSGGTNSSNGGIGVGVTISVKVYNSMIDLLTGLYYDPSAGETTINNGTAQTGALGPYYSGKPGAGPGSYQTGPFQGTGAGYGVDWNSSSVVQPWGYVTYSSRRTPTGSLPAKIAAGTKITASALNAIITALNSDTTACTCNCNYCTCNCNYCTCNCNYSCTCNCNYSDERVKTNIEYM